MCAWDTDASRRQTGSRYMTEPIRGDKVQLTIIMLQTKYQLYNMNKSLNKIDRQGQVKLDAPVALRQWHKKKMIFRSHDQ